MKPGDTIRIGDEEFIYGSTVSSWEGIRCFE